MVGPARLPDVSSRPVQDGHGVGGLACPEQGTAQADACRDDSRMPGREFTALLSEHPLVQLNGLCRGAGRQVGTSQVTGHYQGIRVPRPQLGVAPGGELPPVLHGWPGQAGVVKASAGPQQQRMAPAGPQHVRSRAVQAGRVRPQPFRRPRLRLLGGHVSSNALAAARAAGSWARAGADSLIAAWSAEFIKITGPAAALLTLTRPVRSRTSSASQAAAGEDGSADPPIYAATDGALETAPGIP